PRDISIRLRGGGVQEKTEGLHPEDGGRPPLQHRPLSSQKWEDRRFRSGKRARIPGKSQVPFPADAAGSEDSLHLDLEGSERRGATPGDGARILLLSFPQGDLFPAAGQGEIGRASCRERGAASGASASVRREQLRA